MSDALEIFLSSSPYGLNIAKEILYWPTNSKNYPDICQIVATLLPNISKETQFPDYFDIEFAKKDKEYYNLCCTTEYTSKALLQRLIMNLLYYKLLDKFIREYDEIEWTEGEVNWLAGGGKKKQKGGMKLNVLLLTMVSAFSLLGSSEGIETGEETLALPDSKERSSALGKAPFAAAKTKEELLQGRMVQASSMLSEITAAQPWDLGNKTYTIAKNVSPEQITYFMETMEGINLELVELSQTGMDVCRDLAQTASLMELFSSDIHMQRLLTIKGELEKTATTPRTADVAVSNLGYVRRGVGDLLYKATGALTTGEVATLEVDSGDLMLQAHAKLEEEMQMVTAKKIENLGYGAELTSLCSAMPNPRFDVFVNTTDGASDLTMRSHFGNNKTGLLFNAVTGLIVRIELKEATPGLSESEKNALKSLKQRNSIILQSIQKGSIFKPLDLMPGVYAVQGSVAQAKSAKRAFASIIALLMEELPLDKQASENMIAIRKSELELRELDRKQTNEEWRAFANTNMKAAGGMLSDAVSNGIDVTTSVVSSVSAGAQNITTEVSDVGVTLVKGVGKIGATGAEELANTFWAVFPALLAAGGLAGAAAFGFIWFKRNLFSFSNGSAAVPRALSAPPAVPAPAPAAALPPPAAEASGMAALQNAAAAADPLPLAQQPQAPAGGKVTRKSKNKKGTKRSAGAKRKVKRTKKNKKQKGGKRSRKNRNKK